MKEIKSILSLYNKFKSSNEKAAIAQVVRVEESSYRREGARMLVFESGVFEGGISGGCLEGDALKRSQMAIFKEKPSIVTYDTSKDDENQIGVGLGCNGVIDVLISPITSTLSTIPLLEKCVSSRQSHVLITITACPEDPELLGTTYYFDTKENTIEGGKLDLELKEEGIPVKITSISGEVKYFKAPIKLVPKNKNKLVPLQISIDSIKFEALDKKREIVMVDGKIDLSCCKNRAVNMELYDKDDNFIQ
uniref:XdhC family protein n=1 Tax=uncultured Eudoraea sp. TaxID=1035614 RepID=UPI0026184B55